MTYLASDVYDFNKNVAIAQSKEVYAFGACAFPYYLIKNTKTNIIKNSITELMDVSSLHHITLRNDLPPNKKYELFSFIVDHLASAECLTAYATCSLLWLIENTIPVYTSSGEHLLSANDLYTEIYVECGGDTLSYVRYQDTNSQKLIDYFIETSRCGDVIPLKPNEKLVKYGAAYVSALGPCDEMHKTFPGRLKRVFKGQNKHLIIQRFREEIVNMDLVHLYSPDHDTLILVLSRIRNLIKNSPVVWDLFLRRRYDKFTRKMIYNNIHSGALCKNILRDLLDLFPEPEMELSLNEYGDKFRLALVPDHILSYSLGLRISTGYIANELIVNATRSYVNDPAAYVNSVYQKNKLTLYGHENSPVVRNKRDTLDNKIYTYPIDDVISYLSKDGGVYFYTRPEFEKLKESPRNFYTRETIPVWTLAQVHAEMLWSSSLPESKPIEELMKDIIDPVKSIPEYCYTGCVVYISHTPTGAITRTLKRENSLPKSSYDIFFNKIEEDPELES
jgi:hypothetical protein